jgi:hypothetical protein
MGYVREAAPSNSSPDNACAVEEAMGRYGGVRSPPAVSSPHCHPNPRGSRMSLGYSARTATAGSTRVARTSGPTHAARDAASIAAAATTNVLASMCPTP